MQIVDDADQCAWALATLQSLLPPPKASTMRLQNIFALTRPNGKFWIAQCLINFGFSQSSASRSHGVSVHSYDFQIAGLGILKERFAKYLVRPSTGTDKFLGKLFNPKFKIKGAPPFNDKYRVIAEESGDIRIPIDVALANAIARYPGVILTGRDNLMAISFDKSIHDWQTAAVADIFSHCSLLA